MDQLKHRPTLYMVMGVPGSGKTTWAKKQGLPILSSDAIREELTGSAGDQDTVPPKEIFRILDERVGEYLKHGEGVIYDALNIEPDKRRPRLKYWIEQYKAQIIGVLFTTPIEIAKERNKSRERVVRDDIIERFARIFEENPLDTTKDWFDRIIEVDEHGGEKEIYRFEHEKKEVGKREEKIITPDGGWRPKIR
jgi:predicted kinase